MRYYNVTRRVRDYWNNPISWSGSRQEKLRVIAVLASLPENKGLGKRVEPKEPKQTSLSFNSESELARLNDHFDVSDSLSDFWTRGKETP